MSMPKPRPVSVKSLDFLERLARLLRRNEFVLAGDTGLAMQLNHRLSLDFDFFTSRRFNPGLLLSELKRLSKTLELLPESQGTLTVTSDTLKTSIFHHPHVFLDPVSVPPGIPVAGVMDIGAMNASLSPSVEPSGISWTCIASSRIFHFGKLPKG